MAAPVQIFQSVQLTTSGVTPITAVKVLTPRLSYGQTYRLMRVTAQVIPQSTNVPRFKVYKGFVDPGSMIDGDLNGNLYASGELDIILRQGDFLTFQWLSIDDAVSCHGVAIFEQLEG